MPIFQRSDASGQSTGETGVTYFDSATGAVVPVDQTHPLPVTTQGAGATAAVLADGTANPTTTQQAADVMVFNGTTWDRVRSATADALAATGLLGSGQLVFNGATWDRIREPASDTQAVTGLVAAPPMVFNGATYERPRSASASPVTGVGIGVVGNGLGVVTSIAAGSTAVANGTTMDGGVSHSNHTMTVVATAGTTAGVVQLQGSPDNVNWVNIGTAITLTAPGTFAASVTGQPWRYIRAAITTLVTGGTITGFITMAG